MVRKVTYEIVKFYKVVAPIWLVIVPVLATEPALTITSPKDYQVFQRETKTFGKVRISGSAPAAADHVEARLQKTWAEVPLDPVSHTFRADFPAPAGGFYSLTIRAVHEGAVLEEATVAHVG